MSIRVASHSRNLIVGWLYTRLTGLVHCRKTRSTDIQGQSNMQGLNETGDMEDLTAADQGLNHPKPVHVPLLPSGIHDIHGTFRTLLYSPSPALPLQRNVTVAGTIAKDKHSNLNYCTGKLYFRFTVVECHNDKFKENGAGTSG
ncbi:unnamed protein product [Dibothriocephalus latus]|uniref:Uncharacterized protein n=1 Tax=Dibothriocephalus latus TaxID=60516 RepID=A0A3P6SPD3_DIBLA|nr:unnamed protein product [Dibothriocephalus latus]